MNHERALDPEKPMTDVRVGSGLVENNPINLDMREAGAMVHVTFGINIVVDTSSRHSGLFCGEFDKAWQASCGYVQKGYGLPIDYQADVVIASCGGFPEGSEFYQSTKTLFNASRAVKEGGTPHYAGGMPGGSGSKVSSTGLSLSLRDAWMRHCVRRSPSAAIFSTQPASPSVVQDVASVFHGAGAGSGYGRKDRLKIWICWRGRL